MDYNWLLIMLVIISSAFLFFRVSSFIHQKNNLENKVLEMKMELSKLDPTHFYGTVDNIPDFIPQKALYIETKNKLENLKFPKTLFIGLLGICGLIAAVWVYLISLISQSILFIKATSLLKIESFIGEFLLLVYLFSEIIYIVFSRYKGKKTLGGEAK